MPCIWNRSISHWSIPISSTYLKYEILISLHKLTKFKGCEIYFPDSCHTNVFYENKFLNQKIFKLGNRTDMTPADVLTLYKVVNNQLEQNIQLIAHLDISKYHKSRKMSTIFHQLIYILFSYFIHNIVITIPGNPQLHFSSCITYSI